MKVIDLLNKVANGEEVPNMVLPKWFMTNMYLHYDKETKDYYNEEETYELFGNICLFLNDEVEIIEDKKIEKIKVEIENERTGNCYIKNEYGRNCYLTRHSKIIIDKLNEIIDCINKEK